MKNSLAYLALGIILAAVTVMVVFRADKSINPGRHEVSSYQPQGDDFHLPSARGDVKTEELRGKVLFVFFGFLNCPHICPTTLQNIAQMTKQLSVEDREKLKVIFVSIDNKRDSLEKIDERLKNYGDQFVGGTDTDAKLHAIADSFGAFFSLAKDDEGATIHNHSSDIFVVNGKGKLVQRVAFNSNTQALMDAFRTALASPDERIKMEPRKEVPILAENPSCDLSRSSCQIRAGAETYELSIEPKPIVANKELQVTLQIKSKFQPEDLDFQGINLNMGYLRPKLTAGTEPGSFKTQITLPSCELNEMRWRVRVFLKDSTAGLRGVDFYFNSRN